MNINELERPTSYKLETGPKYCFNQIAEVRYSWWTTGPCQSLLCSKLPKTAVKTSLE